MTWMEVLAAASATAPIASGPAPAAESLLAGTITGGRTEVIAGAPAPPPLQLGVIGCQCFQVGGEVLNIAWMLRWRRAPFHVCDTRGSGVLLRRSLN